MTEELSLKIDIELAEFKKQLIEKYSPKPQFEVGKVYKEKYNPSIWRCTKSKGKNCSGYGIDYFGNWVISDNWSFDEKSTIEATNKEWEQALVKEAERKYKPTDKIKSFTSNGPVAFDDRHVTVYYPELDVLEWKGNRVYFTGKWAEIIPQEEVIKIGSYEVEFCDNNTYTLIGGYPFSKKFWLSAKEVAEHTKAAVWLGCGAKVKDSVQKWHADLPTINSILNKLK